MVSVGVTATPITISLSGTTMVGTAQKALAGQQLGGSLSGLPFVPGVGSTYQWSVTTPNLTQGQPPLAADVFYNYNPNDPNFHQLTLLSDTPGHTSGSTFSFYDKSGETINVTCHATLAAPDGTSMVINVSSVPVSVLKPSAVWNTNQGSLSPGFYFAQGGMGAGEVWQPITITVPTPFSGGTGCLAQLITPTIQLRRYPLNGQPDLCYYKVPQTVNGVTTWVLPGQGLDTHFPYPTGINTDGTNLIQYPNGYQWDVSVSGSSGDGPTIDFSIPAVDSGGAGWYTCYASEIFTTWLMYKPSTGANPVWIPLQRIDWNWQGNVAKDSMTGQWGALNPSNPPGSASSSGSGVDTPDFPQWNTVLPSPDHVYP